VSDALGRNGWRGCRGCGKAKCTGEGGDGTYEIHHCGYVEERLRRWLADDTTSERKVQVAWCVVQAIEEAVRAE
jgi:hypothetical protein